MSTNDEPTYEVCDRGHIDPDTKLLFLSEPDGTRTCLITTFDGPWSACGATVRTKPIDQAWYDAQEGE